MSGLNGCVHEATAMTSSAAALSASVHSAPSTSEDFQRLVDAPIYGQMTDFFGQSISVDSPAFNRGGSFSFVEDLGYKRDGVALHHFPQNALNFFTHADGGTIGILEADHRETRTFGGNGPVTKRLDNDMSFRQVLFLDIWDLRSIAKSQDDGRRYNSGVMETMQYYREKLGRALNIEKK